MDYEKEFEKETGYKARYSQGGITRESLKYVNWLKSKCDALQADLNDLQIYFRCEQELRKELKEENERLTMCQSEWAHGGRRRRPKRKR